MCLFPCFSAIHLLCRFVICQRWLLESCRRILAPPGASGVSGPHQASATSGCQRDLAVPNHQHQRRALEPLPTSKHESQAPSFDIYPILTALSLPLDPTQTHNPPRPDQFNSETPRAQHAPESRSIHHTLSTSSAVNRCKPQKHTTGETTTPKMPAGSGSGSAPLPRSAMRRLMKELDTWNNTESAGEQGIERLGPVSDDQLLAWESVINGRGVGHGYDSPSLLSSPLSLLLYSSPG